MKVTVQYACSDCSTTFPAYCSVPDHIENHAVKHVCPGMSEPAGVSKAVGVDGVDVSYMCDKCGHVTKPKVTDMVPAMVSRRHGCGAECEPV